MSMSRGVTRPVWICSAVTSQIGGWNQARRITAAARRKYHTSRVEKRASKAASTHRAHHISLEKGKRRSTSRGTLVTFDFLENVCSFKGSRYARYSDWFREAAAIFSRERDRCVALTVCCLVLSKMKTVMSSEIHSNYGSALSSNEGNFHKKVSTPTRNSGN
ncbi:hypothetical protein EYF80_038303 [Liparis tanakae]|uniref:Uncharacterized protein n=1 Tax=Liparis tanakae TaxID=230148 RepID=A0A4Z2GE86_9TELE|nr:hypothetical protein EYF80_038303 [Liparis tanakae]